MTAAGAFQFVGQETATAAETREPGPEPEPAAGGFDSSFVMKCLYANQIGDAEIFRQLHRGRYLYDHAAGQWYRWTGHFWEPDKTESVVEAMQAVCRIYEIELQRLSWRINKERGQKNG